jgi:hypothetical protein
MRALLALHCLLQKGCMRVGRVWHLLLGLISLGWTHSLLPPSSSSTAKCNVLLETAAQQQDQKASAQ